MNIKQLETALDLIPHEKAVMLVAEHGVGKTEIIQQIYKKRGYKTVVFYCSQMSDTGDIIGMPDAMEIEVEIEGVKKREKVTKFSAPEWWPFDPNEKVLVLLDEYNRAKPEILQAMMQFTLGGQLGQRHVNLQNVKVCACINPADNIDLYAVEEMDPAQSSRWAIYSFMPEVSEWLEYATKTEMNDLVIDYIRKNNGVLDAFDGKKLKPSSNGVRPCRRSWETVSKTLKRFEDKNLDYRSPDGNDTLLGILSGMIGNEYADQFCKYVKNSDAMIDIADLIEDYKKYQKKIKKMTMINQKSLCDRLIDHQIKFIKKFSESTKEKIANVMDTIVDDIQPDISAEMLNRVFNMDQDNAAIMKEVLHITIDRKPKFKKEKMEKYILLKQV